MMVENDVSNTWSGVKSDGDSTVDNEALAEHGFRDQIVCTGFVSDTEKWALLSNANIFLFPTLYEGFGLPVLEAQQCGVPVVTSNTSSLMEIAGESAITVNPEIAQEIARAAHELIQNEAFYQELVARGHENLKRFDWVRAGRLTAKMITMET